MLIDFSEYVCYNSSAANKCILHMAQSNMNKNYRSSSYRYLIALVISASLCLVLTELSFGAIYGYRDSKGNFLPKVTVSLGKKELVISKIDSQEKFKSFALIVNKKNTNLIKNLNQLSVEWLNAENKGGKPTSFVGPSYDATKLRFEEPMTRSATFKLTDKSGKNVLAAKSLGDLFTIQIDQNSLVASESSSEPDSPVRFGSGRDVSLNLDKTSIQFDESNIKKGEIINLDNRSGLDQIVGIELPEKSLLYYQIVRKPEQTKVPRENWDRFNIPTDSGIFVVLIPDADPNQLAALNGKEILIKVYQGDRTRETLRVPIKTASDSEDKSTETLQGGIQVQDISSSKPKPVVEKQDTKDSDRSSTSPEVKTMAPASQLAPSAIGSTIAWVIIILNLIALLAVVGFGAFFLLPRIQVLEDRLAKSEMFIHGSREAIREELDLIKEEVFRQTGKQSDTD